MAQKWRVSIKTAKVGEQKRGIGIERYNEHKPDEIIYFHSLAFNGSNRETFAAALEIIKQNSNGERVDLTSPMRVREILRVEYPQFQFTFNKDVGGFADLLAYDALQGGENSEQLISEEEL